MTPVEGLGLLFAIVGLAFAFEGPRMCFLKLFRRRENPAIVPAQAAFLTPTEKDKVVNSAWWEASDLRKQYESQGFNSFHWSNAERVAEREQQGHEVVRLHETESNVRFRIVNKSGQVLMAKSDA